MSFDNAITPINSVNTLGEENFTPYGRGWEPRQIAIKESTAYAAGQGLRWEISGSTTTGKAVSASTQSGVNANGGNFIGILGQPVRSTDSDYATAFKLKTVYVPISPEARARFTVGAGTFTNVDVGKTVAFHTDGVSLAVDTAGQGAQIEGYISSTRGICSFPMAPTTTA